MARILVSMVHIVDMLVLNTYFVIHVFCFIILETIRS